MRFLLPNGFDFACRFKAVEGRIQRSLLEPQQTAARFLQPAQDLQAMRLAPFECGEDHCLKMAAQFVAADRFHAIILDRLGIKSNCLCRGSSDSEALAANVCLNCKKVGEGRRL